MDLLDLLCIPEKKDYECYSLLSSLLKRNPDFREVVAEGIKTGKIHGFTEEMWKKINDQNCRSKDTFDDVFRLGYNIGDCTGSTIQYSYSLNYPMICGGELPILRGTKNSPDGRHTWISDGGKIIDTSLMLVIDEDFAPRLGYIEQNRNNPTLNPRYLAAKDFANDPEIRRGRQHK